jgi:hypothetical protein
MLTEVETSTFLGPAEVLAVEPAQALVRMADHRMWVTMAIAPMYKPVVGDILLVIGKESTYYAIGLIMGRGKTMLMAAGDLQLCAPRGEISLTAGKGIRIRSDDVEICAKNRLSLYAETVMERFTDVTRWVKNAFQIRAGRMRANIEGEYRVGADRINEYAKGAVNIDGEKINLG